MPGVPDVAYNLTNEQVGDVYNTTLRAVEKGEGAGLDIALDHGQYEFVDGILRENKIEVAGTSIAGRIKLDAAGNAKFIDPGEEANPNMVDTTYPYDIPWRYIEGNFSTLRHDILKNMGSNVQLYDFAKLKRLEGLMDVANLVEESFWAAAAPLATTRDSFWGVQSWAGRYASTTPGHGFYGGFPTGWSDVAGIAPCTTGGGTSAVTGGHEKWRNWCGRYTTVNAQWVEEMVTMLTRMKFKAPLLAEALMQAPYNDYRVYCDVDSEIAVGSYQRKRGDDNSVEVAMLANGTKLVKGVPIVPTDCLDYDTEDPFFAINRGLFKAVVLTGDYLRMDGPISGGVRNHDTFTTFINLTCNIRCKNRRQGIGVINKHV